MTRSKFAAVVLMALASATSPLIAQVASAPTLSPPPTLSLPEIWREKLPNGLTVIGVEMTEVPLVRITLSIQGGARLDGGRPGIAGFAADLLDEGAGDRDAFALAEEVAFLGATLSTAAGWDAISVSLSAPRRTIEKALSLMADVVLQPRFDSTDIQRQKQLRLAAIIQQRDQPNAVASLVLSRELYPKGHPYHEPIGGDSASVTGFNREVVRSFWNRSALPERATLVITGDLPRAEAVALAQRLFGNWRQPANPLALIPNSSVTPPSSHRTKVVLVDKPGAAQSVIAIGTPGPERTSPDYPSIALMNTILGGSFSARLNDILREQKGFTYGANTSYSWRPLPGPFQAGSQVRTDVTDSSLAIFFHEFDRIRREPASSEELERARAFVVLGALDNFETTGQVAGQLISSMAFGFSLERIAQELERVGRLGVSDVQDAARKYLDPERLVVVVVGDLAKIRPGIEALGLGPVEVVEP